MSKVNFSKAEQALTDTLQKIYKDQIAELAIIATLVNIPHPQLAQEKIDETLNKLKTEVQHLKDHDPKLYARLNMTKKEEQLIFSSTPMKPKSWARLGLLKNKIDELKKELYGEMVADETISKQIEEERKKHINKRFNIRDNWLPLH